MPASASGTMQGNYGPASKMKTALGAYTPNVPWAEIDCANIVDMDGAGTSAATPQIAAAAALWLAEHWDAVKNYSQPWMRIEAVRLRAVFRGGEVDRQDGSRRDAGEDRPGRAQGRRRACRDAAGRRASCASCRRPRHSWPWLDLVFGGGVSLAAAGAAASSAGACWRWS